MRIVAVLNQKGGVGKTTTAVNLGAALALRGRHVLLIDADPQGNLTDHLGLEADGSTVSLYDVLLGGASLATATRPTHTERLFVVPAEPDLAAAEAELAGEIGREGRLRKALGGLAPDAYDWVLIDCPPSLGLLCVNAMAAASELLITLQTEYFALKGLAALDRVVRLVREHVNPDLALLGILPTLVNPVTLLAREVVEEVRAHYGEVVLGTRIRQNVSLAEAPSRGTHIFAYKPASPGASDYLRLADEIEGRRDAPDRSHASRVAAGGRRHAPAASAPRADAPPPGPAAGAPPVPPPEPGRTPALAPETPPTPGASLPEPASPEPRETARDCAEEPPAPAARPEARRADPAGPGPVEMEPAGGADPVEADPVEADPVEADPVEADRGELDAGEVDAGELDAGELAPVGTDPVEMDADEARRWFRAAMARRAEG